MSSNSEVRLPGRPNVGHERADETEIQGAVGADIELKRSTDLGWTLRSYAPEDFRFTKSKDGKTLYAFCLGTPAGEARINSLGRNSKVAERAVASVHLLGAISSIRSRKPTPW